MEDGKEEARAMNRREMVVVWAKQSWNKKKSLEVVAFLSVFSRFFLVQVP